MDILSLIWDFNVYLFYLINLNLQNPILDYLMPIITILGSFYLWIIGLIILFIFGGLKEKNTAVLGIITIILSTAIIVVLKFVIAEPRPFIVLDNVNLLESVNSFSFPSNHAATAFAGSLILGKKYGYIYLLMILACLVAFSRVYIGVHYPLDIICGAIIGLTCAWTILKYENEIFSNRFIQSYNINENPQQKLTIK